MNSSVTFSEPGPVGATEPRTPGQPSGVSRLERVIPLMVFLACLAYLCIPLRYSSLEPDEGIVFQGAERVLHGQVPYRDFFSFYTPGSCYFLALLFRIFVDAFIVARLSVATAGSICSVLTY